MIRQLVCLFLGHVWHQEWTAPVLLRCTSCGALRFAERTQ